MQPSYEFTAMLIIRHPSIDPDLLTRELGIEPEYSWRAGDTRHSAPGDESGGRYRETYWAAKFYPPAQEPPVPSFEDVFPGVGLSLARSVMSFESVLALGALTLRRRRDFWQRLKAEGGSAELLVVLANSDRISLKLPADLLATMASLGLSVSVDVQSCTQAAA